MFSALFSLASWKIKAYGALAALAVVATIAMKIYLAGKDSERARNMKKSLESANERIRLKQKQLEIAVNRPDLNELRRVLDDGEF